MGMGNLNSFQGLLYTFLFFLIYPFHILVLTCNVTTSLSDHGIMEQDVCASVSFMTLYVTLSITFFCSAGRDRMEFIHISDHPLGDFHLLLNYQHGCVQFWLRIRSDLPP